jgi:hypothetical protein
MPACGAIRARFLRTICLRQNACGDPPPAAPRPRLIVRAHSGEPGGPAGPAAVTWHVGSYQGLGNAHHALEEWASKNNRKPAGPPWESYVTDPGQEPDPQKWRTQVFLPLQG